MNATVVIRQPDFVSSGAGAGPAHFDEPEQFGFDHTGDLFAADFANSRVLEFMPKFTNGMNASVVIGQPDFSSTSGTTTQAGLDRAAGADFGPWNGAPAPGASW